MDLLPRDRRAGNGITQNKTRPHVGARHRPDDHAGLFFAAGRYVGIRRKNILRRGRTRRVTKYAHIGPSAVHLYDFYDPYVADQLLGRHVSRNAAYSVDGSQRAHVGMRPYAASMVANGRMWDSEPTGAKPPSRPSTSYGDPSVQKRQPGVWPPYGKICSPNAGGRMWE